MRLSVHSSAERELIAAAKWYEDRQLGLGEQFVDEYQAAILRILAAPTSFAQVETNKSRRTIRRCPLKRFPYYLASEVRDEFILILAVAHAKRRPNYWTRRR